MDIRDMVRRFLDSRGYRHDDDGVVVELADNERWPFKIVMLTIYLNPDIYSERGPSHFTLVHMVGKLPMVRIFLSFIPSVEVFLHACIFYHCMSAVPVLPLSETGYWSEKLCSSSR